MPLSAPLLDDRRFEDLRKELLARVPRYAPEWTDHHASDPGVTLLELFAWLTEMTLYRLNQVPERNYIKFLELLGTELEAARPAHAELTFTVAPGGAATVIVPKGTQVGGTGVDGEPVIFELDAALIALSATLAAVQVFDGFGYSVATTANSTDGQTFAPFASAAREGSALLLGFDSPLPFPDAQVNLAVTVDAANAVKEFACGSDALAAPPPARLTWEFWDGLRWQPLVVERDETRAFTRSGHVLLRGPGARAKKATLGAVIDLSLYWLRCRLAKSGYDRAPRLDGVATNTASATQALTIQDEILGGSNGRPDQVFKLANVPVVEPERPQKVVADGRTVTVGALRLEVNETGLDDGFELWEEVDDFFASGEDDRHFVLNRTTGEVRFGDGRRGRIPAATAAPGIVAREYRTGGGVRGNVGAGALSEVLTFVEGVSAVTNRRAALGGAEEELLDDAKLRAAAELKARGRAVTAEDFEHLAKETPGVLIRRAKALPLAHPRFPGAKIPGTVTVIVVPDGEGEAPSPSEETLKAVCQHLDRHRLLTAEVYVVGPVYHTIEVEAELIVAPDADLAEVQALVDTALRTYFHPLTGGEAGTGWEFGRDLFISRITQLLLGIAGVERIRDNQLILWLDGEAGEFCRDLPLEPGALLANGLHRVTVAYGGEE